MTAADEYEYSETFATQHGEGEVEPPPPDGTGWDLVERKIVDAMIVCVWRRSTLARPLQR
jgi:hypothetical protein